MSNESEECLTVSEQAARRLCELAEGGPDAEARLMVWLCQSARHVEEFLFATAVWKSLRETRGLPGPSVEAIVDQTKRASATNIVELQTRSRKPAVAPPAPATTKWRIAGVFALVALGGALAWWVAGNRDLYATQIGEQRTVRLQDGSVLYLNTDSRARVRFTDEERSVRLERGEALFDVAADSARPFLVTTGKVAISVLGTQFNVRQHRDQVVVSVLEGRVRVEDDDAPQLLQAGEAASVKSASGEIVKHDSPDIAQAVAWRERKLVFKDAPLAEVVAEINRYSQRRFSVEGQKAARTELTATFDADKPESLLTFLQRYSDLEVRREGREFVIRSSSEL